MNLLMNYDNVDTRLFDNIDKSISSFDIISQILPPMSAYFGNKMFDEEDDKRTTNNIVEINNGTYLRGQMDKGVLGASSRGMIQSIFNDFGTIRQLIL